MIRCKFLQSFNIFCKGCSKPPKIFKNLMQRFYVTMIFAYYSPNSKSWKVLETVFSYLKSLILVRPELWVKILVSLEETRNHARGVNLVGLQYKCVYYTAKSNISPSNLRVLVNPIQWNSRTDIQEQSVPPWQVQCMVNWKSRYPFRQITSCKSILSVPLLNADSG